jgi:hypothetical protein
LVFFSASNNNAVTFGDTINISNTPDAKSDRAWLTVEGNNMCIYYGRRLLEEMLLLLAEYRNQS